MQSFLTELSKLTPNRGDQDENNFDESMNEPPENVWSLCDYRKHLDIKERFETGFSSWIRWVTRRQVETLLDAEFQELSKEDRAWIFENLAIESN